MNFQIVRETNKNSVLRCIRNESLVSRTDVAKLTSLNKATVSAIVEELIEEHFIIESGIGVSTGGRRPLMLQFNHQAGHLVGFELGVDYMYTILTDLSANILYEKKIRYETTDQEAVIPQMIELIKETIHVAPYSPKGIIGIGIGVPGIVDQEKDNILFAPNLNWIDVPLVDMIRNHFTDINIRVDNEANFAALGEKWFGIGFDSTDIVYISAGMGIGAGVIINNQIYTGSEGKAGEIGHSTIELSGMVCNCGNSGCLEMYASERAVKRELQKSLSDMDFLKKYGRTIKDISICELKLLADRQDEIIINAFTEIGTSLGVGIANIIKYYNPEVIIIGNTLSDGGNWVLDPVKKSVGERLRWEQLVPMIRLSQLKEKSCVIGSVASILEEILH